MKTVSTIYRRLIIAILIVVAGFAINVVIPGIIAYRDNVFYFEDVERKLPARSVKAIGNYNDYKRRRDEYAQIILDVDIRIKKLSQTADPAEINKLLTLRETYKNELEKLKNPIIVSPFYENRSGYYFLAAMVSLALAVFVLRPPSSKKMNKRRISVTALFIYALWMFTNWLRNFAFYNAGRTIFSFLNYDISPSSFFFQEIRAAIISLLISILWHQWMVYYEDIVALARSWREGSTSPIHMSERSEVISQLFNKWQATSIFIAAAFLPWTVFYWINVIQYGDTRYIVSAMVTHFYWAVSWILTSAPLIHAYRNWSVNKARCLAEMSESNQTRPAIEFMRDLNPLSEFQILGAGIASLISFLLPFFNVFRSG